MSECTRYSKSILKILTLCFFISYTFSLVNAESKISSSNTNSEIIYKNNSTTNTNIVKKYQLDEKDKLAVEVLRMHVGSQLYRDFMKTDLYLLRWIKDQDYDLEAAAEKLRKSIQWRKENQIDLVQSKNFSDIARHCSFEIDGEDAKGRPLAIFYTGKCDIRRLLLTGNEDRLYEYVYQVFENAVDAVRKKQLNGEPVYQFTVIADINGFNWRQHGCLRCAQFIPRFLHLYNDNYPRYAHAIYMVNVPRIFYSFLELITPFLPESVTGLLRFYGHDKGEWSKVLTANINPDQLPRYFGGTKNSKRSL